MPPLHRAFRRPGFNLQVTLRDLDERPVLLSTQVCGPSFPSYKYHSIGRQGGVELLVFIFYSFVFPTIPFAPLMPISDVVAHTQIGTNLLGH